MEILQEAVQLRVFIGEADRWEHRPLYEAIVRKARELSSRGRHRHSRIDGLRQIEPDAHREDPAAFGGFAACDRDHRPRGKAERVSCPCWNK